MSTNEIVSRARVADLPGARARAKAESASALGDYDATYLMCRDLRHPWKVIEYWHTAGEVHRLLRCQRKGCGTERTDKWTARGERLQSSYTYPDGYAAAKGEGGVSAEDVRKEVLSRVTVFTDHGEMVASVLRRNQSTKRKVEAK